MHLHRFDYVRPGSFEEAAALLADLGTGARAISGGTDLLPRMKQGLLRPDVLVSLRGAPISAPRAAGDGSLRIDARTPLAELACSPEVRARAPLLAEAALAVATNQIRRMGTLGGNLCLECRCLYYNQSHTFQFVEPCLKRGGEVCYFAPKSNRCWAVFASDTAPALLALGASVDVVSPGGRRRIPLDGLYTGDPLSPVSLARGEFVAEVSIPSPPDGGGQAFRKHSRRGGMEFAGLTVAVGLDLDAGALCRGARIAVGSVAGGPLRASRAEKLLQGQDLSRAEALFEAATAAAAEIRPVAHHGYGAAHLREVLEVETRRALAAATSANPVAS